MGIGVFGAARGAKRYWWRGRLPLYVVGFAFIVALDMLTPFGIAEWLLEVVLVCVAAVMGEALEMVVVAAVGSACVLAGLWTSPPYGLPFWVEAMNRLSAVIIIWVTVYVARGRRNAEAEVRTLRGMLPICASCKRIRYGDDKWQSLESYIGAHSGATFTHTLCPACLEKYSAEIEQT